jgi:hypothetical protein
VLRRLLPEVVESRYPIWAAQDLRLDVVVQERPDSGKMVGFVIIQRVFNGEYWAIITRSSFDHRGLHRTCVPLDGAGCELDEPVPRRARHQSVAELYAHELEHRRRSWRLMPPGRGR